MEIAKKSALKIKDYIWNRNGDMKKRQQRRRKQRDLKEMKKRARHADCSCCGYPRLKIGKGGKTENEQWHEEYHATFKQHPLEGETYEQAKVAAALAYPDWFNRDFDVSQF